MRLNFGMAALALVACGGTTLAAEYVTNGGFETGDFTGWTQFGDTSFSGVGYFGGPHSGSNEAYFGPVSGVGGITQQIIPVSAGTRVNISFWVANLGGTPNFFSADFDGTNLATFTDAGVFGYTQVSVSNYLITNNNPTLSFSFFQLPSYITLDDVSITNAVPLPSAAGLGLVGLLGLGARRRRA